jgi:hypothetical protein
MAFAVGSYTSRKGLRGLRVPVAKGMWPWAIWALSGRSVWPSDSHFRVICTQEATLKRRTPLVSELPPHLHVFTHAKWLKPDEDPTDPIRCHVTAPIRYSDALSEFYRTSPSDPRVTPFRDAAFSMKSPDCPCCQCVPIRSPKIARVPPLGSTQVPPGAGSCHGRFGEDDADDAK